MSIQPVVSLVTVGLCLLACQLPEATPSGDSQPVVSADQVAPGTAPLPLIMQALAANMSHISAGLWAEDHDAVAVGAQGIADHPRVTPTEMAAIQSELEVEFADFVAADKLVHDLAIELAASAGRSEPMDALLETFSSIQRGCLDCHERFRARVVAAREAAAIAR